MKAIQELSFAGPTRSLVLVFLAGLASGCGEPATEAIAVCTNYYESLRNGDMEQIAELYSERFYERTPATQWMATLRRNLEEYGGLQSWELKEWRTKYAVGRVSWEVAFRVSYARMSTEEVLRLVQPSGSGEIRIEAHVIRAVGTEPS